MQSYEQLLDEAYEKVQVVGGNSERFEIPKIEGRFEGKKTILTNFFAIASYLRRDPEHFLKFLNRELATKAVVDGDRVTLGMKISSKVINPKIEEYVREFVLCRECQKPDTELVKDGNVTQIHCLACGAKHPVRTKI